jgi:hypothetical protein
MKKIIADTVRSYRCSFHPQVCLFSQERFASVIKSTTEIADTIRSYR